MKPFHLQCQLDPAAAALIRQWFGSSGNHGMTLVDISDGMTPVLGHTLPFPVDRVCVADDGTTLPATSQNPDYREFAVVRILE